MFTKILAATDGSDTAGRAVARAADLAARLSLPLVIVLVENDDPMSEGLLAYGRAEHLVVDPEPGRDDPRPGVPRIPGMPHEMDTGGLGTALAEQVLQAAVQVAKAVGAKDVQGSFLAGDPATEILDAATETGADLIVLGSRGLGAMGRLVMGSVSEKVLHHTNRTVLVVH